MGQTVRQLPMPPGRLCQVVRATQDPDVPMPQIVRLVSSDPALSLELLRIANSAYYSPRRRIRSVAQAAVFLGLRAVRHHAVSHVLKAVIDQVDLSAVDEHRLWRNIVYRGAAAHVLAELSGYDDPTEAFTTGVILDSGFVMLVALRPEHAAVLDEAAQGSEEERLATEQRLCGTTHPEVFGTCARQWGLPEALVRPIEAHHDADAELEDPRSQRLMQLARLADLLVGARTGNVAAKAAFLAARRSVPRLGQIELHVLLERIEHELPRLGDLVNPPKATRRASLLRDAVAAMTSINDEYRDANRDLEARNAELDRAASEDALTGVANRRAFNEQLRSALSDGATSLVMFDLDHFKAVNDTYGHGVGDDVLCAVCRRVEEVLEPGEQLARLGGEEFAVLMPHVCGPAAHDRAELIRQHLSARPVACRGGVRIRVTGSFGGVTSHSDAEATLKAADLAMYASKHAGRDRVTWR